MKKIKNLNKSLLLITLLIFSGNSFAQKMKYALTKMIDENGRELVFTGTEGGCTILDYQGSYIEQKTEHDTSFPLPILFRFHHKEGSNSIYYQSARDIATGREVINDTSVMIVSLDKNLINFISYFRGKRFSTSVYKKIEQEKYDKMIQ